MASLAGAFSGVLKLNPLVQNLLVKAAQYSFTTLERPSLNLVTDVPHKLSTAWQMKFAIKKNLSSSHNLLTMPDTAVQLRFKDLYVSETTMGLDYVGLFGDIALSSLRDSPEEARNLEVSSSFGSIPICGTIVIVFVLVIIAVVCGFSIIKRPIAKSSAEKEAMDIRLENLITSLKGANDHLANMSTKYEATDILLDTLTTGLEGTEDKIEKLEDQNMMLSSGLAAVDKAHKTEIDQMKEGYERQIAQTEQHQKSKIAKLKDHIILLSSERAAVDSDHENKIAELNKIHGDRIAELERGIAELEKDHGRQIAGLEKENAKLKQDHRHEIAELSVQQNITDNRVAYALDQQTITVNECRIHSREHDAKLQEHVRECDRKLDIVSHKQEKQSKDNQEDFKRFTTHHQEALDVKLCKFNHAIADISKQQKKDLDETKSQIQENADKLTKQIDNYLAQVSRRGQQDFEQFTKRITETLDQMALTRIMTERELSLLMNNQIETYTQKFNNMEKIQRSHSERFEGIDSQVRDLGESVSADKKQITEQLHHIEDKSDGLAREVQISKFNADEGLKTMSECLNSMNSELKSLTDTTGHLVDCVGMDSPFPSMMQMFRALSKEVQDLFDETEMIKEKNKGVYEFFDCLKLA